MSLLRSIIRSCVVASLRDRTWAEKLVYDSDSRPLTDAVLGQAAKPYITVYTDNDDRNPVPKSANAYTFENRTLTVTLEIGVASVIRSPDGVPTVHFMATDQGMEWACDVIESQSVAALYGDHLSEWGLLYRKLAPTLFRISSRRGGQNVQGRRMAARRIIFYVSTLYEVGPQHVLADHHAVREFITLANANPQVGIDAGQIVTNLLTATEAPSWRVAQGYLGLSTEAIRALQPDGTPLPWKEVEKPPLDKVDTPGTPPLGTIPSDEYVPEMVQQKLDDEGNPLFYPFIEKEGP